jgi:hypothetical protein
VALTYPFAGYPQDPALAWQAATGFGVRLIGGYAMVPSPTGAAMAHPSTLAPTDVEVFLDDMEGAQPILDGPVPPLDANLVRDAATFLHRYRVRLVVVDRRTRNAAAVTELFTRALGTPPRRAGTFDVWRAGGQLTSRPVNG